MHDSSGQNLECTCKNDIAETNNIIVENVNALTQQLLAVLNLAAKCEVRTMLFKMIVDQAGSIKRAKVACVLRLLFCEE